MSCHVIQLWYFYIKERRKPNRPVPEIIPMEPPRTNGYNTHNDYDEVSVDSNQF
jgi:hypothetical protein